MTAFRSAGGKTIPIKTGADTSGTNAGSVKSASSDLTAQRSVPKRAASASAPTSASTATAQTRATAPLTIGTSLQTASKFGKSAAANAAKLQRRSMKFPSGKGAPGASTQVQSGANPGESSSYNDTSVDNASIAPKTKKQKV